MHKPVPPAKFSHIIPPNQNYTYFEDKDRHPFNAAANTFNVANASWLADFALLAYGDEGFVKDKFERAGLFASGFEVKFFSRQTTQCFVAHNDDFAVLSFRGTEIDNFMGAFADWLTNLNFQPVDDPSGGRVHRGFAQNIAAVWNEGDELNGLKAHLRQLLSSGKRTLWMTGHSLGAALALLAAERAVRDGGFTVNGVYTFGSPCVGDTSFKHHYLQQGLFDRTHRFVHNLDVVRRLPPAKDYQHVGHLKFIDAAGRLHEELPVEPPSPSEMPAPTLQQERAVRLFRLVGRKLGSLAENLFSMTIPAPFANHAPIYYAVHIGNHLNQESK